MVADARFNRVVELDKEGKEAKVVEGFRKPSAAAVDMGDVAFVADKWIHSTWKKINNE